MITARLAILLCMLCNLCFLSATCGQDADTLSTDDFRLLGIARAQQSATLRIPRQGLVQAIYVKEGDSVHSGQRLLSLDDRIAQAALLLARTEAANVASLKISKIDRDRLAVAFERAEAGFQQNVVGQFELDAKRSEFGRATAAYELELERQAQAKAKQIMSEQEVASMSLFAPFDGTITQIHAKVGDAIGPSENAITIANHSFLEIELYLPLSLYGRIEAGKMYQVQSAQPVGSRLEVLASYVAPEIEPTSGTFRAVFVYDNRQTSYPSGFEVYFIYRP